MIAKNHGNANVQHQQQIYCLIDKASVDQRLRDGELILTTFHDHFAVAKASSSVIILDP